MAAEQVPNSKPSMYDSPLYGSVIDWIVSKDWDKIGSSVDSEAVVLSDIQLMGKKPAECLKLAAGLGMTVRPGTDSLAMALAMNGQRERLDSSTVQSFLNISPLLYGGRVNGYREYDTVAGQPGHVVVITGYETYQGELWLLVNDPFVDPRYAAEDQREFWFTYDELTSTLSPDGFAYWYNPIK